MIRAYVRPPKDMSRAMWRIANALEKYAPADVRIVQDPSEELDIYVLHVISLDFQPFAARLRKPYAVMQYCTGCDGGRGDMTPWYPMLERATMTWSYYDLSAHIDRFYHAPLGIDQVFRKPQPAVDRDVLVMTSGFVNGQGQEAIDPLVKAAHALGPCDTVHLGPMPTNVTQPFPSFLYRPTDEDLAEMYARTRWVGALRYMEGFEMGAAEGLACGARPIMFDRPEARKWFDDLAYFVPETTDEAALQVSLEQVLRFASAEVHPAARELALQRFNWRPLVEGFWARVKENL